MKYIDNGTHWVDENGTTIKDLQYRAFPSFQLYSFSATIKGQVLYLDDQLRIHNESGYAWISPIGTVHQICSWYWHGECIMTLQEVVCEIH